jgi:Flp pilus assembly protein TadD
MAKPTINLGNVFSDLKRHEEARRAYVDAVQLMPADANAHYNLGNELDELGRHSDALVEYEKAARLKPRNADIQFNLGNG